MTRFGIYAAVIAHAKSASRQQASMAGKRISPHTLRNSTRVHLLRAGADINALHRLLGRFSGDERLSRSAPDTGTAHSSRDLHQPPSSTVADLSGFASAERGDSSGLAQL
jgi:hypothetical protein